MNQPAKDVPQKMDQPAGGDFEDDFLDIDEAEGRFLLFNVVPSWLISFVVHVVLILLMAFLVMPTIKDESVAFEASQSVAERLDSIDLNLDADLEIQDDAFDSEMTEEVVEMIDDLTPEMEVDVLMEELTDVDIASEVFETPEDFGESIELGAVNEVVSRSSEDARQRMVRSTEATLHRRKLSRWR